MAFKMKKNGGLYMRSPNKNYQNPEEYKAFNMGNEADKLSKEEKSSFKMKGFSGFGNSPSPAKLKEVLIENEDGVMVSAGTGPEAREKAKKIAIENKKREDMAFENIPDFKTEEEEEKWYDDLEAQKTQIRFTEEDEDINEQALEDIRNMEKMKRFGQKPESTDIERQMAVSGSSLPGESREDRMRRIMNQE